MRYSTLIGLLFLHSAFLFMSCNKSDDNDDSDNENIPDTSFDIEVSGDQSNTFNITIPAGEQQTDFTIVGAYVSVSNLLTMNFSQVPSGWGLSINVIANNLSVGSYQSNPGEGAISSYNSTGQESFNYLSETFTVDITKAELFASSQGADIYYLSGDFMGTMASPQDGGTVSVSGSFSGVPISSQ